MNVAIGSLAQSRAGKWLVRGQFVTAKIWKTESYSRAMLSNRNMVVVPMCNFTIFCIHI